VVSIRPAGNTVGRLALFDGQIANGRCSGTRLGNIRVDRGSGRWQYDLGALTPAHLCIQSPGGGVASGPTADLVTERTKRMQAAAQETTSAARLKAQLLQEFEELEEMEAEKNRNQQ
jgi:hypothetical protein